MRTFFHRCLVLLALLWNLNVNGSEAPEFILLIDLSPKMERRKPATMSAARDLVRTGVHHRLKDGERMGVWFFDEIVYTNAPLVWESEKGEEFGRLMVQYFEGRAYRKQARLDRVVEFLNRALRSSPELTGFILTDGTSPVEGTPFDEGINSLLWDNRERFARAEKPFLITLLGHDGKWTGYGVHVNLGRAVELPSLPGNVTLLTKAIETLRGGVAPPAVTKVVEAPVVEKKATSVIEPIVKEPEPESAPPPVVAPKPVEPAPIVALVAPVVEKPPEPVLILPEPEPALPVITEEKAVETATVKPEPTPVVAGVTPVKQRSSAWPIVLAGFGILAATAAMIWLKVSETQKASPKSLMAQAIELRNARMGGVKQPENKNVQETEQR